METTPSESIFSKFPAEYLGLAVVAVGLLFVLGAILNWDWVLEGDGRIMNIAWISDKFGRKAARILVAINGAIIILAGIVLFWAMNQ